MEVLSARSRRSGRPCRPALRRALRFAALAAWFLAGLPLGRAQTATEDSRVKAVFVLNFVHFVRWPPGATPADAAPLVIGVLGTDPVADCLDEAVRGETLGTHPLTVRRYRRVEEVADCQLLFISESEAGSLGGILAGLDHRSILTVSDAERFSERGGMISFVTVNNKIRLKINVGAARAANLQIDARLLRPAQIVVTEKG